MNIVTHQNKAISYHRSSQCRCTQRWPQTTDTCHWLHTRQRAGTRTCHPNRAQSEEHRTNTQDNRVCSRGMRHERYQDAHTRSMHFMDLGEHYWHNGKALRASLSSHPSNRECLTFHIREASFHSRTAIFMNRRVKVFTWLHITGGERPPVSAWMQAYFYPHSSHECKTVMCQVLTAICQDTIVTGKNTTNHAFVHVKNGLPS